MSDLFNYLTVCSNNKSISLLQHINHSRKAFKKQFAHYDSDTPVTLKQDQGHETWYKMVDSKV